MQFRTNTCYISIPIINIFYSCFSVRTIFTCRGNCWDIFHQLSTSIIIPTPTLIEIFFLSRYSSVRFSSPSLIYIAMYPGEMYRSSCNLAETTVYFSASPFVADEAPSETYISRGYLKVKPNSSLVNVSQPRVSYAFTMYGAARYAPTTNIKNTTNPSVITYIFFIVIVSLA